MNIEKIKKDLKKQFILPYKEEFINKFKIQYLRQNYKLIAPKG